MEFKEAYRTGQEKKALEVIAQKYSAWPKTLISCSQYKAKYLEKMTNDVRGTAKQKAKEIKIPKNLLNRIGFNLGYILGHMDILQNHTNITNASTLSGRLINSFSKAAY